MRNAFVGALFALLPLTPVAATVTIPDDAVVMPDTPSGEGDPNTIVCRAPQQLAGSNEMGPKRCGYNWEWWQLTENGKGLAPDGKTVIDRPMVSNPTGTGNPDAVTCRSGIPLGRSALGRIQHFSRAECRTNRFWASLLNDRKWVSPAGNIIKIIPIIKPSAG